MPLCAAIDIGSNTIRLLIAQVSHGDIADVLTDRKITQLGNLVSQTGRLQDSNMEASLAVLERYASIISEHEVRHVTAVGTSALREASNSGDFIQKVFSKTGIHVKVISGNEEARLTVKGILSSLHRSSFITDRLSLILDIGGGSTEWIICRGTNILDMGSIPVGVIKLRGDCIRADPVSADDLSRLTLKIIPVISQLKQNKGSQIQPDTIFIGSSGTFTTIATVDLQLNVYARDKVHLHSISFEKLQDIREKLSSMTLAERLKVTGLEPERADLIIPGLLFTINVMECFQFGKLTVSDYGLLEGVITASLDRQ
jgi:exopolyphosphatase/guanosine-5'-triphosphate,3'-diphosphate pyrophosphatase